jgi:hypothetical protein
MPLHERVMDVQPDQTVRRLLAIKMTAASRHLLQSNVKPQFWSVSRSYQHVRLGRHRADVQSDSRRSGENEYIQCLRGLPESTHLLRYRIGVSRSPLLLACDQHAKTAFDQSGIEITATRSC